jgi:hypothetical protein
VIGVVADFFWCVIGFLQTYNGAVTAAATVAIGFFTLSLVFVTNRQARLTRAGIEIAQKEFIASHRAKMRIRRITVVRPPDIPNEAGLPIRPLFPDHRVSVRIEAANIGDTQANVYEMGIDVYTPGPFNAAPQPYPGIPPVLPGQEVQMTASGARPISEAEIDAVEAGALELRLLGIINYRDDNGVIRSTSFARVYSRALGRFVKVADDDPEADREFEN